MLRCGNNLKNRDFPEPTHFNERSSTLWTKSPVRGLDLAGTGHLAFCPRAAKLRNDRQRDSGDKKRIRRSASIDRKQHLRDATRLTLSGNRTMTFARG